MTHRTTERLITNATNKSQRPGDKNTCAASLCSAAKNHNFGVALWPPQDCWLIVTMATSDQTIMTKPTKHTGPGVPRWCRWLQNFDS